MSSAAGSDEREAGGSTTHPFFTVGPVLTQIQGGHVELAVHEFIGTFVLKRFPASENGVDVDVTFEIDGNGALTVTAASTKFDLECKITIIDNEYQLSEEEVTKMTRKEEKYKGMPEKQWKCDESKRSLDEYIRNVKTNVAHDLKKSISKADKKKILDLCKNIGDWMEDDEPREIEEYQAQETELKKLCIPILRNLEKQKI